MVKYYFSFLFLIFLSFHFCSSANPVIVEALQDFKFFCDVDTYYIIIGVSFQSPPKQNYYPFTINLGIPSNFNFKCMLEYDNNRIYCFSVLSNKYTYIENGDLLQLPYQFPKIEGIIWDYNSFIRRVYRKVWTSNSECGKVNSINGEQKNNENEVVIEKTTEILPGIVRGLTNDKCGSGYKDKFQDNYLSFDMEVDLQSNIMKELLDNGQNKVEFMQDIWVPLLPPTGEIENLSSDSKELRNSQFHYAYCSLQENIKLDSIFSQKMKCYLPIPYQYLFKGNVKVSSFYDKVFIKIRNGTKIQSIKTVKINFSVMTGSLSYIQLQLQSQANGILCPNKPIFTIENQDSDIKMENYYPTNYKYTFSLKGTLTNGYTYQGGEMVPLSQTENKIRFNLTVTDNFLDEDDEMEPEVTVDCVLNSNTLFNEKGAANILCLGNKPEKYGGNNNVDISLNWAIKENNNFDNIIIKWPKTFETKKKNMFIYDLVGISLKQTNYGCSEDKKNFNFYIYIYDLKREPKLSFNLNMVSPKSPPAYCEVFDSTALKCNLNLKYKALSKGSVVGLPYLGNELKAISPEGNIISFIMNNFTNLENPHDFYITLDEKCGQNVIFGTFGGLGLSKPTIILIVIMFCIFVSMIVSFVIYFIIWRVKYTYKRDKKLTLAEESKTTYGIEGLDNKNKK